MPLTGPLAESLERQRDALNARFAAARMGGLSIDPDAFAQHLAENVDPVVCAVDADMAERTDAVTASLYELSLPLVAKDVVGPKAKQPILNVAWRSVLPAIPRLVAREPARVAGCVTNAIANVASTSASRAKQWIDAMCRVAVLIQSTDELLASGAVIAWRCGMAQYRSGAIDAAGKLRAPLARAIFGWADNVDATAALDRMLRDAWLRPEDAIKPAAKDRPVRLVATAGAFRGFGGEFIRPPVVRYLDGRFVASDFDGKESTWSLFADAFGAALVRDRVDFGAIGKFHGWADSVDKPQWDALVAAIGGEENIYSVATDGNGTIAATMRTSHQVYVIARASDG